MGRYVACAWVRVAVCWGFVWRLRAGVGQQAVQLCALLAQGAQGVSQIVQGVVAAAVCAWVGFRCGYGIKASRVQVDLPKAPAGIAQYGQHIAYG